jgi:hypothetical protein
MWIDKVQTCALAEKLGGEALVEIIEAIRPAAIWAITARCMRGGMDVGVFGL